MKIKHVVLAVTYFAIPLAFATPGGVDSAGCHNSKKIGYHCHPERSGSGGNSVPVDGTQRQRDTRLSRECRGMPNAGACLGFAK